MELRPYQIEAVESVLREFESVQSTLIACATGTGKTRIAQEVITRMRAAEAAPVIFMAHRREILEQTHKRFEAGGLNCEYELADQRASEMYPADVLLASVQTMVSGRNGERRMHKFSPYSYGLIVVDEVHHGTAASYRAVLDYFKANADIKVLGLTATPERADEEALGQIMDSVAYDYPILQAIQDGWLVPVEQQLIDIQSLDFSHIKTVAGDLNQGQLGAVMEEERNLYGVCDAVMREIGDRRAIMFAVTVRQAELACDILNRYRKGVASWACGKTDPEDRSRIIREYREGATQLFVNVDLVSEGTDFPEAELFADAAPTKSAMRYTQRLGRFLRPLPGTVDNLGVTNGTPFTVSAEQRRSAIKASKKPVATVMDFVGNAGKHKLIHAIDILGGKISDKTRELAERVCRETGKPMQIDALVLEAEKREREEKERLEAAKRAKLTGKATYTIRTIDPFNAFDMVAPPRREWYRGKALTAKQRELLLKQGLNPDRMSYSEGKAILDTFFHRWKHNLATLRQCACLKPFGYDTRELTKAQASELITQLKANNWRKI